MAWSRVQPTAGHAALQTGASSSVDVTPVSDPVAGHLLVLPFVTSEPSTIVSITDNAGNVWQIADSQANTGNDSLYLAYCENCLTHASFKATIKASGSLLWAGDILEYANIRPIGALDQHSSAVGSGTASVASPSRTPTLAASLCIGACSYNGSTTTIAAGASNTLVSSAPNGAGGETIGIEEISSGSAYTAPFTLGTGVGEAWESVLAIFFPATGPVITAPPAHNTVRVGTNAVFTVVAVTSGGTLHYQWKLNGVNVGSDSPTYVKPATIPDDGSAVTCTVTDNNGSTVSATATLVVTRVATRMPLQQRMSC